ncbi:unnamed protein product [Withania somnifera]
MEMGLKLTRVADELSSAEFQFAKDRADLLFQSTETDTLFILTVHLKGYTQENVKIDINEEGNIITIRGEKPVQETVMLGWKLIKKDVEIRKFSKAFKIPDGVILDKIKARFDEEKFILTVKMPKKVKGILGIEFEEVKTPKKVTFKEDMDKPTSSIDSESTENQEKRKEIVLEDHQVSEERELQLPSDIQKPRQVVEKHVVNDEVPQMDKELTPNVDSNIQNNDTIQEIREPHKDFVGPDKPESSSSTKDDQARANEISEEESGETKRKNEVDNVPRRSSKICVPIVAGSALILSLVVFVIHFIRNKNQSGKRKG